MSKQLRVVYFGTSEFAVPSLDAVVAAGHDVLAVVTQPDKPHGRGMKLAPSPVKIAAERLGLPVLQPRRVRDEAFIASMRELAPDALALAAFGQIIPKALLDLPPLGPVNVHGSLLPKYRGAAPIQRAIMSGETETGITTIWMAPTLDTGDILMAESLPIDPNDTSGTLIPKLAELGARLLVDTLAGLAAGTLERQPQDDSLATLAPAIKPEDGLIDWRETATAIRNRIRGVTPKPGAFASIGGRRIKVWAADLPDQPSVVEPAGTVLAVLKRPAALLVASGEDTTLLLTDIQPENGKRMLAADWARGARIVPGSRFDLTPTEG